ncbi:cation efflux protein [Pterulicium gracile]|uniref:Cation efflux protein n=1 Tax=Pterulicium gracile TaxID=1884261 RepID=A0A5C3QH15_9AGAR|nr:cation efflux protein [Pterula gracilis]
MVLELPSLSKTARLSILLVLTGSFFVVEIVVGYYSNSLALIADSFHMLRCVTKRASKKTLHPRYSYGMHRAEIVAALANGVFLLALCLTIFLDALGRFYSKPDVSNPRLVVIVGSVGLGINLLGLLIFHDHDHGHGATADHRAGPSQPSPSSQAPVEMTRTSLYHDSSELSQPPSSPNQPMEKTHPIPVKKQNHSHHAHAHAHGHDMNMRAVMFHVLGDASGNIAVIASGLVMWLSTWKGRFYVDPAASLLFSVIIFSAALPLVRSAAFVLLQAAPPHISVDSVRTAILSVPDVSSLHELHVWQLSESKAVASVHITTMAAEIKKKLHELGVHSCTIQPEESIRDYCAPCAVLNTDQVLFSPQAGSDETLCMLQCPRDRSCDPIENACCRALCI